MLLGVDRREKATLKSTCRCSRRCAGGSLLYRRSGKVCARVCVCAPVQAELVARCVRSAERLFNPHKFRNVFNFTNGSTMQPWRSLFVQVGRRNIRIPSKMCAFSPNLRFFILRRLTSTSYHTNMCGSLVVFFSSSSSSSPLAAQGEPGAHTHTPTCL